MTETTTNNNINQSSPTLYRQIGSSTQNTDTYEIGTNCFNTSTSEDDIDDNSVAMAMDSSLFIEDNNNNKRALDTIYSDANSNKSKSSKSKKNINMPNLNINASHSNSSNNDINNNYNKQPSLSHSNNKSCHTDYSRSRNMSHTSSILSANSRSVFTENNEDVNE
eukprot:170250_1